MMRVSTKGRYALRVMLDLALHKQEGFVPLKDMSARQSITPRYMEIIISILVKAGYVTSNRGKSGGYRLSKDPHEYTLYDILVEAEGSLAPIDCLSMPENMCPRKEVCSTLYVWEGLDKLIKEYFQGITIEDLMNNSKDLSYGAGI